jgi:hypothetical protein
MCALWTADIIQTSSPVFQQLAQKSFVQYSDWCYCLTIPGFFFLPRKYLWTPVWISPLLYPEHRAIIFSVAALSKSKVHLRVGIPSKYQQEVNRK